MLAKRADEIAFKVFFNMCLLHESRTSLTAKHESKGWFNYSRSALEVTLQKQDILIHAIRNTHTAFDELLRKLKAVREEAKDAIATEKMLWCRKLDEDAHNVSFNPRRVW